MTIIDLFLFLFATAGLTFIIVHATIMDKLRIRQTLNKNSFLKDLIKCSLCTGFWVAAFFATIVCPSKIFLLTFAGSAFAFLFERTTIFLDEKIHQITKHE